MEDQQSSLLPPLEEGAAPPAAQPSQQASAQQESTLGPPQEPQFQPEQDPTRLSELARTPQFLTSAPQDIIQSYGNAATQAYDDLTSKTDNWLDFFKRKGRGALGAAGLPYAGLTPAIAHLGAAATHAAGSAMSPQQAALDVPDTVTEPYQGHGDQHQVGLKDVLLPQILGGDLNPNPGKPRGLVSSWAPAADVSTMLQKPQGATLRGMEKMPPAEFHSGDIFKHGSEQYDYIKQLGGKFDPDKVSGIADEVQSTLRDAGFPRTDPQYKPLWRAVDQLRTQTEPTFQDIDRARQTINEIGKKPGMGFPAGLARTGIDDFWRNVGAMDMTGNPEVAPLLNEAIHTARRDWTQGSKLETLENFRLGAELKEGSMMGGPEMEKTLVNTATRLLDPKNKALLRGWSKAEIQALQTVQQGTVPQRLAAQMGKWAPELGVSPVDFFRNGLHLAIGHFGSPLLGGLTAGTTYAAKKFAEGAARRNWSALQSTIAGASPAYKASHIPTAMGRLAPTAAALNVAHQMAQQRGDKP